MKITYQEETYEYKFDSMIVAESKALKNTFGFKGPVPWAEALESADGEALAALLYFAKKRAGEVVKPNDFDNVAFMRDVNVEVDDDEKKDESDESGDRESPT